MVSIYLHVGGVEFMYVSPFNQHSRESDVKNVQLASTQDTIALPPTLCISLFM